MQPQQKSPCCSRLNCALIFALQAYARSSGCWKVFDSSGGFRLPDGSVLSPDASLVSMERWQELSPEQRRGFPPLCPDLVVELTGSRDQSPRGISALRRKMAAYIRNGAQLGWLLLPEQQTVEIWRTGHASNKPECLKQARHLEADPLLPGFCLDLTEVWQA